MLCLKLLLNDKETIFDLQNIDVLIKQIKEMNLFGEVIVCERSGCDTYKVLRDNGYGKTEFIKAKTVTEIDKMLKYDEKFISLIERSRDGIKKIIIKNNKYNFKYRVILAIKYTHVEFDGMYIKCGIMTQSELKMLRFIWDHKKETNVIKLGRAFITWDLLFGYEVINIGGLNYGRIDDMMSVKMRKCNNRCRSFWGEECRNIFKQ